jgi:Aph-1 protein
MSNATGARQAVVFLAASFICMLSLLITSLMWSMAYGVGLQGTYLVVTTLLLSSASQEGLRFLVVEYCRKTISSVTVIVRGDNRGEEPTVDNLERPGSKNHRGKPVHNQSIAKCTTSPRRLGDDMLIESLLEGLASGTDGVDITAGIGWAITKGLILFAGPAFAAAAATVGTTVVSLITGEVLYRALLSVAFGVLDVFLTVMAFRGTPDTLTSRLSLACAFHAGAVSLILLIKPLSDYFDGSNGTAVVRSIVLLVLFSLSTAAGLIATRMKHVTIRPLSPLTNN